MKKLLGFKNMQEKLENFIFIVKIRFYWECFLPPVAADVVRLDGPPKPTAEAEAAAWGRLKLLVIHVTDLKLKF